MVRSCLKAGPAGAYKLCHMWLKRLNTKIATLAVITQRESRPFRSSALSFPGAKSPQREHSAPWNFRFCETFVPRERTFQELETLIVFS